MDPPGLTPRSVTVVSIIRLQAIATFTNSTNATFDNYDVQFWSVLELNVGIMCACMPAIRQILVWLFPIVFRGSSVDHSPRGNIPRSRAFRSPKALRKSDDTLGLTSLNSTRWGNSDIETGSRRDLESRSTNDKLGDIVVREHESHGELSAPQDGKK